MKPVSEDRALQDYLDGRLSGKERERFERRMEADPDLAARVAAGREVGAALRDGEESLSPGFYTRARARFEETTAQPERRWFRLFSWESAGLAVAVVLAAALFVPPLVRQDLPGVTLLDSKEAVEILPAEARDVPKALSGRADKDADMADRLDALGYVGEAAKAEKKAAPPDRQPKGDVGRTEAAAESEDQWAPAPATRPAPTNAPAQKSSADEAASSGLKEKQRAAEPPRDRPQSPDPQPDPSPGRRKRMAEDDLSLVAAAPELLADEEAMAEGRAAQEEAVAGVASRDIGNSFGQRLTATIELLPGTLLPAGVVDPGAIRIVDSAKGWDELRFGPAVDSFGGLGSYSPEVRMLLIGARPAPFECRWVRVIPGDETYRVQLSAPEPDGVPASHGCAIALPRDEKKIVMDYSAGFE